MRKQLIVVVALLVALSAGCGPAPEPQVVERTVVETREVEVEVEKEVTVVATVEVEVEKEVTPVPEAEEPPLFYVLYATPIEEPWCGIVDSAMQKFEDDGSGYAEV
jgi:hypothetical protein